MMLLFCICANIGYAQASDFVTKWDLSKPGTAGNNSIDFYTTNAAGTINYTWSVLSGGSGSGSGSFTAGTGATRTISGLPASAIIELRIAHTNLQRFYINNGTDKNRLTDVTQWGTTTWTSMEKMFYGCANLNITSTDLPILKQVTNMSSMFQDCSNLNGPANIGNWNIANVTDMSFMFSYASAFNQNIGNWNTANVTTMYFMLEDASAFNQNLGNWVLNSSVDLTYMLILCGMDCANYSRTLAGWALTTSATDRDLGWLFLTYGTNVSSLRSLLTTPTGSGGKGWAIGGDAVSSGTCGPTVFYSKSTGDLDDLATWGSNTNGTGTSPTDFTDPDQYFAIRNRSTASLSGNWSTTGANSLVILGDGTNAITLTMGTNTITGTVRVLNNATLQIGSNPSGMNFICDNGSTVNYNGSGAQDIALGNYYNLTISGTRSGSPAITLPSGTINIAGDATFTATGVGSWSNTGNTINYRGAVAQQIGAFNYNNLTIAGSSNKTLGGNVIVGGDLTLSNKLILGANNLTLSGSINGGSSSNYLQTNSTGTLKKNLSNTAAFTFTVGNSAYNPVTITNNTGTADDFTVRVQDAVYTNGLSGTTVATPRVDRTWQINKTNANAGSGVNFTFQWNSGEEVGGTPAMQINHHNGSSWAAISGLYTVGSGYPMTLSYSGYTGTFSPFAIGDDIILLPVSWLYMRCNNTKPGTNTIQWATASQTNSRSFVVERSSNGKTFVALDSLAAAGNSHNANHYSYVDEHADLPEAYYRIKQVDENGSEHLSEICLVQTKSSKNSPMVSIYPNPAASVVFLSAGEKSLPYNWALYNTTGQLLASGSSDGGQASINLSNIGKGIYNLHIQGEGFLQNVKLLVNP